MQQEKLTKGIYFGYIGNILFVAFGMICTFYNFTYSETGIFSRILEVAAYSAELMGFGLLAYADWLLIKSIRLRRLLKIGFTVYILLEAVIMVLELNSHRFEGYEPYSLALAMVHAALSGLICFSFLQLDPENVKWEITVGICFTMIAAGMLGNILGIRIYFSVMTNAIGFSALFKVLGYMRERQEIEIDCYGDRATVAEYSSSTLFAEEKEAEEAETETEEEAGEDTDETN